MVLCALPADGKSRRAVALVVARALSIPAPRALALLSDVPFLVPRNLSHKEAAALVRSLDALGASCKLDSVDPPPLGSCCVHSELDGAAICSRCDSVVCAICIHEQSRPLLCPSCCTKRQRGRLFFRLRVTALLLLLVGVLGYAWRDVSQRRARNDWDAAVDVGLVILQADELDPGAIDELVRESSVLEGRLASEFARYRGTSLSPFRLTTYGPISVGSMPPKPQNGILGTARFGAELWWYLRGIDEQVQLRRSRPDAVVYILAHRPRSAARESVEGLSQQGGRVGIVEVELDREMASFAMFVVAHELFHTLGANDKYDAAGNALLPTGLGDPNQVPQFPQRYAEVMARNLVLSPGNERPPNSLDELRVGPTTAREIGWIQGPR